MKALQCANIHLFCGISVTEEQDDAIIEMTKFVGPDNVELEKRNIDQIDFSPEKSVPRQNL